MVLCAHKDAGYLNATKYRSQAGEHIMLRWNDYINFFNGPILTIAQLIKFVMSSAAKGELASLLVTSKMMAPLKHTWIEMGYPQPPSPLQTDNYTEVGVVNKKSITKITKSMYMLFY